MYVVDDQIEDWRFREFKALVERHGGTVVCRVGDEVRVRIGDEEATFRYTLGGAA